MLARDRGLMSAFTPPPPDEVPWADRRLDELRGRRPIRVVDGWVFDDLRFGGPVRESALDPRWRWPHALGVALIWGSAAVLPALIAYHYLLGDAPWSLLLLMLGAPLGGALWGTATQHVRTRWRTTILYPEGLVRVRDDDGEIASLQRDLIEAVRTRGDHEILLDRTDGEAPWLFARIQDPDRAGEIAAALRTWVERGRPPSPPASRHIGPPRPVSTRWGAVMGLFALGGGGIVGLMLWAILSPVDPDFACARVLIALGAGDDAEALRWIEPESAERARVLGLDAGLPEGARDILDFRYNAKHGSVDLDGTTSGCVDGFATQRSGRSRRWSCELRNGRVAGIFHNSCKSRVGRWP